MAKRIHNGLKLIRIIAIFFYGAACFVSALETSSYKHAIKHTFHAAENRALVGFAFAAKPVRSRVICGRECSMDENCKSFNFNDGDKTCELNLGTRREDPKDFVTAQGSVYFDADEDTPLYSLAGRCRSCKMLLDAGHRSSGIYTIYPEGFGDGGLRVYCDMETDGGGWIVLQRRQDGSVDFYRNWAEYQTGFGHPSGEFWLGNDNMVTLTADDSRGKWELRVDLQDSGGHTAWAKYSRFLISPGEYNLMISQYDGNSTAGESFEYSRRMAFTTKDVDNDDDADDNCAQLWRGAWWFSKCGLSHLNGPYDQDSGLRWQSWDRQFPMKECSMKMRELGT